MRREENGGASLVLFLQNFKETGLNMLALFGSMYAAILGASIVSKEESDRTIEFLLAKPVSRGNIITQKLLAGVGYVLSLNVAIGALSFIAFELYKQDPYSVTVAISLFIASTLMHLLFFAIGLFISMYVTKAKAIMPLSIGLVLASYFVDIAGKISEKANFLRYLSPFYYADSIEIIQQGSLPVDRALLVFALSAALIAATYVVYQRKDITT